jgi:isopenicillin N synthase-like dioxygenase
MSKLSNTPTFDPFAKEQQLRAESASWVTADAKQATPEDIPVLDLAPYLQTKDHAHLQSIAAQLRQACEQVGFFSITGHQISPELIADILKATNAFHHLSLDKKQTILMDSPNWPVRGAGYLPLKNKKLPTRNKGNLNEAFIVKIDDQISMNDNQWPDENDIDGFRMVTEKYAAAMEQLGKAMLPIFATALEVSEDFFDEAFIQPTYRLRMTHYPPVESQPESEYGIAPHVDTSFCTILLQDKAGLTIFDERSQQWMQVPYLDNAFIINTGELLKQWSNDRFLSVKHFANNNVSDSSRYSVPFFFNANAHYPMTCIPSCCSAENPPKYPPISYANSQAIAQGE